MLYDYEAPHKSAGLILKLEYVGAQDNQGVPRNIEFFAYLKSFTDSAEPSWEKKSVYGRTDPLVNYNGTSRKISVSFDIPAKDLAQARDNLYKLSKLITFTYPVLESSKSFESQQRKASTQIKSPPILRFSFGNLIRDYQTNGGLYGFIDSPVVIDHKLEYGMFISSGSNELEPTLGSITTMYPKIVEMSLQYQVLHNHQVGWDINSRYYVLSPYGMNLAPTEKTPLYFTPPEIDQSLVDEFGAKEEYYRDREENLVREVTIGNNIDKNSVFKNLKSNLILKDNINQPPKVPK